MSTQQAGAATVAALIEAEQTALTLRWQYLAQLAQKGNQVAAAEMTRLLPLIVRPS
jgi:hypothetical protein